jgi:hypothetical protein
LRDGIAWIARHDCLIERERWLWRWRSRWLMKVGVDRRLYFIDAT